MTEKECLKALDCLYDDDAFDKEVWGFVMEGDNLSCADVERAKKYYRDKIYNLIKEHFSPQPYKLEDLKEGMWVYDIIWEECFEICEIFPKDNEIHVLIHQNRINVKRYEPIKFEEGRFFPVTKAMEYQK